MSKRTICLPNTCFGIFLLILSLSQIILLLPLLFYGILQSLNNKLPKLFKYTYWITSFIFLLAGIAFPIHFMFNFEFAGYCDNLKRIEITVTLASGTYMLSLVLVYCLYFVRLYLSFRHSSHSISIFLHIVFIFGAFIQFILLIIFRYLYLEFWGAYIHQKDNVKHLQNALNIAYQTFSITNIMYNILLLSIFLIKLYKLRRTVSETGGDDHIQHIIKPAVVYTLCLALSFVSTFIQSIITWIRNSDLNIDSNEFYMLHLTYISYDVFINALSVNLQFKYSNTMFIKCCSCCYYCLLKRIGAAMDIDIDERHKTNSDAGMHSNPDDIKTTLVEVTTDTCTTTCTTTKTSDTSLPHLPQLETSITQYNVEGSKTTDHIVK